MKHLKGGFYTWLFYVDSLEVLRQLVVAIGSDLFLDSLAKNYEKMAPADSKAKIQKIYFHKIRPPNSFSNSIMIRLYIRERCKIYIERMGDSNGKECIYRS